MGEDHSKLCRK